MVIAFKKLHPEAVIPEYATPGSAGMDLVAAEGKVLRYGEVALIGTGLAVALPTGLEMQIRPRSGLSKHFPNYIANSPGTIDSDYRGEIKIMVINNAPDSYFLIRPGDRIAQGVIAPVGHASCLEVEELPPTERGDGGFGHTGIN